MSANTKAAWGRIRERYERVMDVLDRREFYFGDQPAENVQSINDEIQAEYRAGRITEPERNEMRRHVKTWLGDPDAGHGDHTFVGSYFGDTNFLGYETYACGIWAPTGAPWGEVEHAIVLGAITIMELEDDPVTAVEDL